MWWVPGAAVALPMRLCALSVAELLTVLSSRKRAQLCLGVGRPGRVPDEMRRAMPEFGISIQYKVLLFEKKVAGRFSRPRIRAVRLATATTHDMPRGSYWRPATRASPPPCAVPSEQIEAIRARA